MRGYCFRRKGLHTHTHIIIPVIIEHNRTKYPNVVGIGFIVSFPDCWPKHIRHPFFVPWFEFNQHVCWITCQFLLVKDRHSMGSSKTHAPMSSWALTPSSLRASAHHDGLGSRKGGCVANQWRMYITGKFDSKDQHRIWCSLKSGKKSSYTHLGDWSSPSSFLGTLW